MDTQGVHNIEVIAHGDFLLTQIARAVREKTHGDTKEGVEVRTRDLHLERDSPRFDPTWNARFLNRLLLPTVPNSLANHGLVKKRGKGVYVLTAKGVEYVKLKLFAGPSPLRKKLRAKSHAEC